MTAAVDSEKFLPALTQGPGVYQMLDADGETLYVGKAKNLKVRVSSYFRSKSTGVKTRVLMTKTVDIQITATESETEALLLEQNLIKNLKPAYNILLRDDKSYPYIFLTDSEAFPALGMHRGLRKKSVRYFGPFPSAGAVRETLHLLQKSFLVRQCDDSYFKNRSRPCLQYQIKKCKGPCVDLVRPEEYAEDVRHTQMFLEGKDRQIINELTQKMEQAAQLHEYERAAQLRDQTISLRRIQEQQYVSGRTGDVDVIAGLVKPLGSCVQVLFVRAGRILGSRSYYPKMKMQVSIEELLEAFLPQFYLGERLKHRIPREIILGSCLSDDGVLREVFERSAGFKVRIAWNVRGERARWVKLAAKSAEKNLLGHHASKMDYRGRLLALQNALQMDSLPQRMECFDVSHSSGEATVASCVVFDREGPLKSDYRKFNISGITAGDDYAAMTQALQRRYKKLKSDLNKMPDLLLIDGGKGQLRIAEDVLAALGVTGVMLVGVAKGSARKPGLESLFIAGSSTEIVLSADSGALHLVQHIRDEAHRFAITSHRLARGKKRKRSSLERIPGIGPKRRRELLNFFGGLQEIERASQEEMARVPSISNALAEQIYANLHNE